MSLWLNEGLLKVSVSLEGAIGRSCLSLLVVLLSDASVTSAPLSHIPLGFDPETFLGQEVDRCSANFYMPNTTFLPNVFRFGGPPQICPLVAVKRQEAYFSGCE